MFAVYNNGSVGFRSSADNLYQLKNTDAPSKTSLKPDDDTMFQELMTSNKEETNTNPNKQALDTYKKMAHLNNSETVYHVQDIINDKCICIHVKSTIQDAYDTLKEYQVSQIPIVEDGNKIMGMINKKIILNLLIEDIDNAKYILGKKLEDLYLDEIITTDPISDIRRVSKVMIDFRLDAIPVVNKNDVLVGIVSKTDIIKAVSHIPKLQLWS